MRNKNLLIIDTGFFVALFSEQDRHHKNALALRSKIEKKSWITTWPVVTETCHLLLKYAPHRLMPFLGLFRDGVIDVFNLSPNHFPRIIEMIAKYEDLPADLADVSLVLLAEEISCGDIVSTDQRDFKSYRWKNKKPFRNLMEQIG